MNRYGVLTFFAICSHAIPVLAQSEPTRSMEVATKTSEATEPQDKKPKKAEKDSKRLDAIEKQLEAIARKLDSLEPKPLPAANEQATEKQPLRGIPATAAASKANELPKPFSLQTDQIKSVQFRSIGPANMGGRITDIAVHEKDPSLWYVATASGGLLKTSNRGTTVTHCFDKEETVSIGAIATDPNDLETVWVGTGEANPRNSVSYGNGVYKSTDGGKTWKHKGLKDSYQIGRVIVHPTDSKTVYVGALGRLYGPNEERGVFKTTDGGDTWQKVFYLDDKTGVIDMVMDPKDPNTLIAAMWDRQRDEFDSWPGAVAKPDGIDGYDPIRKWGPTAGLYKTTDAGKSWKKLSKGLPTSNMGRIGIDWQLKGKQAIFAIIDCADIGKGLAPSAPFFGASGTNRDGKVIVSQVIPKSPADKSGIQVGDQLISFAESSIKGFDEVLEILKKKKVGDSVAVQFRRGDETKTIDLSLTGRPGSAQQAAQAPGVWLGVTGEDRDGKVVVVRITPDGPADTAGLKEGDVILQLEEKAPQDYASLIANVRTKSAGDKVKVQVQRDSEKMDFSIVLENRPSFGNAPNPQTSNAYLGIQGENAEKGGAVLNEITPDGPAQKAGLLPGDIVQNIGGRSIADYDALINVLRQFKVGEKTKITISRDGSSKEIEVTLEERVAGLNSRPNTYSYFGQTPNIQDVQGADGHLYGGVYRSDDGGENWERVNSLNTRPMYFSVVKVDPSDDKRVYVLGVNQFRSSDGGITFEGNFGNSVHADNHDLWIDPMDGRHMIIGGDGGFYVTHDRGTTWDHINTTAVGQFYHVAISPKNPYWVFGGLQDNGSWGGPAISKTGGAINEDWVSVSGGDGFVCRVDQEDPDLVYFESQNGSIGRRHLRTGERASIRPGRSANGASYRFNWNTPFILSNHNSKIFYSAGNFVFRSLDRGNNLVPISPEITLTQRGSATALCESPKNPSVLYAGTDDGALWVTKNGGTDWKNITKNLGIAGPRWVATIDASRFEEGRVFVALDGHRSDDDRPYLFESNDYGDTWRSLSDSLPRGSTRCLREDLSNPNMLYAGTEFSFFISMDRGGSWTKCNTNLPTVAIHEVAQHPTNGEIVLATHGRSLWACDVAGLRQLKPEHLSDQIAFFKPEEVIRWRSEPSRGRTNRRYASQNPASGAQLWYSLPKKSERVSMKITNVEGQTIRELRGSTSVGLQKLSWDLVQQTPSVRSTSDRAESGERSSTEGQERGTGGSSRPRRSSDTSSTNEGPSTTTGSTSAPGGTRPTPTGGTGSGPGSGGLRTGSSRPVPNGTYKVTLVVDGKEHSSQMITVLRDPTVPEDAISEEVAEEALRAEQRFAEKKKEAKLLGISVYDDN
jgi:S1-C subfamily serine protease/photosystem II stability/assembly factor-like uncharacterized protein